MKIRDEFIKQSSIMVLAIGFVNFFNLLFHLFMVRNLSTIDYGILNSLFAMFMIISIPATTIQTVIAKFVSHFQVEERLEKIKFLIKHLGKRTTILVAIFFLFLISISSRLSIFLQLPDNRLVILLGASLTLFIILPVFWGGLQGLQRFGVLGFNMMIGGGLKFVLGVILVFLGFRVMGALGALLIAALVQLLLASFSLRQSLARLGPVRDMFDRIDLKQIYNFFYPVAFSHLCFMMLTNSDILLVKHFFSPLNAGHYSVASMVGKMILFLPAAISIVMFPKASSLYAEEKSSISVLKKSLIYSGLLCIVVGLIFIFYPVFLIRLLSIKEAAIFIPLARMFVIAMTSYALIYIMIFYNLSIHNMPFLYTLFVSILLQIILICIFHNSLMEVVSILTIIASMLFLVNLLMILYQSKARG